MVIGGGSSVIEAYVSAATPKTVATHHAAPSFIRLCSADSSRVRPLSSRSSETALGLSYDMGETRAIAPSSVVAQRTGLSSAHIIGPPRRSNNWGLP